MVFGVSGGEALEEGGGDGAGGEGVVEKGVQGVLGVEDVMSYDLWAGGAERVRLRYRFIDRRCSSS